MDRAAGVAAGVAADLGACAVAAAGRAAGALVDSPQSGDSSSLGTDRNICCREGKSADYDSLSAYRWALLKQAKKLLRDDQRLQKCMVAPVPGTPVIELRRDPNHNAAHFRYVEHCHNPWACPVCSAWLTNQKRKELTDGLARAKLLGWHPVLVTFTLRHDAGDRLAALLDGLNRARRRMLQARTWRALKAEYGLKGQIRALEITWGSLNGWHPHLHVLLFLDERLDPPQIEGLRRWLFDLWRAALAAQGFDASYAHGVDVRTADSEIAEYVAKWGHEPREMTWDVEHEIAKAPAKLAHGDGFTPFLLLEASIDDPRAAALFREYAEAMRGRHQIEWSKGLRDELAAVELPAADAVPVALPVYSVVEIQRGENWNRVCKYDLQPKMHMLASIGAADELRVLLRNHGISAAVHDAPNMQIEGRQADSPLIAGRNAIPVDCSRQGEALRSGAAVAAVGRPPVAPQFVDSALPGFRLAVDHYAN